RPRAGRDADAPGDLRHARLPGVAQHAGHRAWPAEQDARHAMAGRDALLAADGRLRADRHPSGPAGPADRGGIFREKNRVMLAGMVVVLLLFTLMGMEIAWAIALACFFYIGL